MSMGKKLETLLITQKEVDLILNMENVVKIVENTYREYGLGKVKNPAKLRLDLGRTQKWPDYNAFVNAMPAYIGSADLAGIKWAGEFRKFRKAGADQGSDIIILLDPRIGVFKAILDGTKITNFRTGAEAVIGMKYLTKKQSKTATIIGAGVQGRTVLLAMKGIISVSEVRIFDINLRASEKYVEEMKSKVPYKLNRTSTLQEAITGADIVVTATTSKTPFITKDIVEQGQLFVTLGFREIHEDVPRISDKIIVDNLQQNIEHSNLQLALEKGKITKKDIYAEIGEIVTGKKKGRETNDEIIIFSPIGMGCLDVAVAAHIYDKAIRKGLGTWFSFVEYQASDFISD